MTQNKIFTINSRKYDGKIHRSWKAEVIDRTKDLIVFKGVFESEVRHTHLNVIRRGTVSYEFYWRNHWYNIFRFHEPEGDLRNFYCNVNLPPTVEKNQLDYVDLDIDVLVWKDFSCEIIDLNEFEENSVKYNYSNELRAKANESVAEVLSLIKNREFPFDYKE